VTRPRAQSAKLVRRLEQLGAVPLVLPTLEVREPADWGPVDRALENLSGYQWLVFTSVNGVHALLKRLRQRGYDIRSLPGVRLAAIGPATADALREYYLEPDVVPAAYRSESLAAALKEQVRGQHVLLARADRGREVLREELASVASVDQVAVYSQIDAPPEDSAVLEQLQLGAIDYVRLTSSNVARVLIGLLDASMREPIEAGKVKLVSISPVTSGAIRELGLPVAAEAQEYTMAGVVQTLIRLAEEEKKGQ